MLDIVILAAGKGTRMKSKLPKVLHPVGGRPLLQHVLQTARALGSERLKVVIGHGAEQVEQQLAADDIEFVLQQQQLGTGHAVQVVADQLRDDAIVLILYGDVPLIAVDTLQKLAAQVNDQAMGLLTVNLANPQGYGRIIRDQQGLVTAIVEQKDATAEQLAIKEVNTGVMAVKGAQLKQWLPQLSADNAQQEYYLTDIIALCQQQGVSIATEQPASDMEVLGVNNRQQQAELERYFQMQNANRLMAEGVTLLDPQRFDCRGELIVGSDVVIDINCVFEGRVELADGVIIGPNCVIKDTSIGANCQIKANSHLDGTHLQADCDIGPYARLRPGTELAERAKIGNFVETKKAHIGRGSKVNHLSYVGDASIGEGANIGAGTITCNYDGVNKFKTEIGDGAFIGSNSALVAPVNIGAGATVAAGSTINKDVPGDELAVARSKQRNVTWQRPQKK